MTTTDDCPMHAERYLHIRKLPLNKFLYLLVSTHFLSLCSSEAIANRQPTEWLVDLHRLHQQCTGA